MGKQTWGNQRVFVLCCVGVVVGFSNFWSFPALMVEHGGSVFLLSYLFALMVFAVPLLVMQVALGRHSRKNLMATLMKFDGVARFSLWRLCGFLLLAGALLTVVLYAVVAGMGMSYVFESALGGFNVSTSVGVGEDFLMLHQDTGRMIIWLSLFVIVVFIVSVRGIHDGLGVAMCCFIPVMAVILFSLLIYSARLPGFDSELAAVFVLQWDLLSWPGLLAAFKQAFYSLAIGTGVFVVLGTYMPADGHITRVVVLVAAMDALIGVLAGLIIIPWLSMAELALGHGFSLIFHSLPIALGSLPLGQFFGAMFYVLLTLAAWSSAIILIEPAVAMVEETLACKRAWASLLVHLLVWAAALLLVHSLTAESVFNYDGVPLFSIVQSLTASIIIPVAGILLVFLLVFLLPTRKLAPGLGMDIHQQLFRSGYFCIRFIGFPLLLIIQLAVVFDLLAHSCQFERFRQGALCMEAASPDASNSAMTAEHREIANDNSQQDIERGAPNALELSKQEVDLTP